MHLNYFALRHFSSALGHRIKESTFINAFSFSKEEIIFSFLTPKNIELFLSVHLENKSCYLQLLESYHRPKRNFLFQFEESNGGIVEDIIQINFDRSFYIKLKTGFKILFKLHGGFSNIVLINQDDEVDDIFRKEFANDRLIQLPELHKTFDLDLLVTTHSMEYADLKKLIPILDAHSLSFLEEIKFLTLPEIERKNIISTYFKSEQIPFTIIGGGSKSILQIFPKQEALVFDNAIEAYLRLARLVLPSYQFENSKSNLFSQLMALLKKSEKQLFSSNKQLENAMTFIEYEHLGHIIMANMHAIQKNLSTVELFDFYNEGLITIRLDKNLNAQENAEKYYRKSKALKHELPNLEKNVEVFVLQIARYKALLDQLQAIEDIKPLKAFAASNNLIKIDEEKTLFPFRKMLVDDYEVWIGKNATNNDLLTFNYAHKNDTWLHAKDVSGSHVIIKNQSGKIITKSTIEKVASITAYYSKSKNQGLAAVQYTIKKFVMKAKGRNPGKVHLLSEQTVLVKPGID